MAEPFHLEPELEITIRDFKFKNSSSETRIELSFITAVRLNVDENHPSSRHSGMGLAGIQY